MEVPHTTAGAELLACDLDATCIDLDCAALVDEFGEALLENPEGMNFLAHYCGLEFVENLPQSVRGVDAEES